MKNILKCGVLAIALLAPITAFAGMGDPSPNATGIGGVNESAEMSPALSSIRLCGPGTHSVYFRNEEGHVCAPNWRS